MRPEFFIYLAVMAGVTYLVRAIPLLLVKKPIKNKFLLSFLHYIPYAVLAAMTVPAIFYATDYFISDLRLLRCLRFSNAGLWSLPFVPVRRCS